MFKIEQVFPMKNGTILVGRFTIQQPKLSPGEMLIAQHSETSQRIGLVRFGGVISGRFTHEPTNPRYELSVSFDGDYRKLLGAVLVKL